MFHIMSYNFGPEKRPKWCHVLPPVQCKKSAKDSMQMMKTKEGLMFRCTNKIMVQKSRAFFILAALKFSNSRVKEQACVNFVLYPSSFSSAKGQSYQAMGVYLLALGINQHNQHGYNQLISIFVLGYLLITASKCQEAKISNLRTAVLTCSQDISILRVLENYKYMIVSV